MLRWQCSGRKEGALKLGLKRKKETKRTALADPCRDGAGGSKSPVFDLLKNGFGAAAAFTGPCRDGALVTGESHLADALLKTFFMSIKEKLWKQCYERNHLTFQKSPFRISRFHLGITSSSRFHEPIGEPRFLNGENTLVST